MTAQAFDIYATVSAQAALATATAVPAEPTIPASNPATDTPIPVSNPATDTPIPAEATVTTAPTPTLEQLSTPVPEPTAEGSSAGFTVASRSQNFDPSCGGQYIRGSITRPDGAPVPGILVVAVDRYDNTLQATSKADGLYDIPISDQPNTFQVRIIDGPSVTIEHTEELANTLNVCHVINWQLN